MTMMEGIVSIAKEIENGEIDILGLFDEIANAGDIILLQGDGGKAVDPYLAAIIMSGNPVGSIQENSGSTENALKEVLAKYLDIKLEAK
jgi:hypothetical protein